MHTSTTWVDFRALREKLSFRDILSHFKIEVPAGKQQYKGTCPLPNHREGDSRPTFSADLNRGIFKCFGCGKQGNLLEFAAFMQGVDPENGRDLRRVALELQEALAGAKPTNRNPRVEAPARPPAASGPKVVAVNAPLDFELKGLEPGHKVLRDLGISEETARFFGIGYTDRGSLKGRIAIPLHDSEGRLVGYAGKAVPGSAGDGPEYVFPEPRERNGVRHRFRGDLLLYNAWRYNEPQEVAIVASRIEEVWALHQAGVTCAVSTMEPCVAEEQLAIVGRIVAKSGRVVILAGNRCSQEAATRMAGKLATLRLVRMTTVRDGQPALDAVRAVVR